MGFGLARTGRALAGCSDGVNGDEVILDGPTCRGRLDRPGARRRRVCHVAGHDRTAAAKSPPGDRDEAGLKGCPRIGFTTGFGSLRAVRWVIPSVGADRMWHPVLRHKSDTRF